MTTKISEDNRTRAPKPFVSLRMQAYVSILSHQSIISLMRVLW